MPGTEQVPNIHTQIYTHTNIQEHIYWSILIIHRFCIYKFAWSLEFTIIPQSIINVLLQSFTDMYRVAKNLSYLICILSAEADLGDTTPSFFRSCTKNKCPFYSHWRVGASVYEFGGNTSQSTADGNVVRDKRNNLESSVIRYLKWYSAIWKWNWLN